jgi:hypothetical protein
MSPEDYRMSSSSSSAHPASSAALTAVPTFRDCGGNYARWKPMMQAYIMRVGLDDSYQHPIEKWSDLVKAVRDWSPSRNNRSPLAFLTRRSIITTRRDGDDPNPFLTSLH